MAETTRRKPLMERLIEAVAGGLGDGIGWLAAHGVLFAVFAVLWIAFGAALVAGQDRLDQAWEALVGLPAIVQLVVWLLVLPVTAGLWTWQTDWPLLVRLVLIAGLAGWTLVVFMPRRSGRSPRA